MTIYTDKVFIFTGERPTGLNISDIIRVNQLEDWYLQSVEQELLAPLHGMYSVNQYKYEVRFRRHNA